jgi:hypothetical protein
MSRASSESVNSLWICSEPAKERFALAFDDRQLPVDKLDVAHPFRSRTVLRENARPVLPVHRDLHAPLGPLLHAGNATSPHADHRVTDRVDDLFVLGIAGDTESPHASRMRREASIPEIDAQEVGVLLLGQVVVSART